jgi:outer membrane protein OmpA-like peptidoglycan-associated protein
MKRILVVSFLLLSILCQAQNRNKAQAPRPGDKIRESILIYKNGPAPVPYEFPNGAFSLIYRFGELNGKTDNYDSLYKMVTHIYRLNRYFGPRRKPSRLICYFFVDSLTPAATALHQKINQWTREIGDSMVKTDRAGFNFNRPWQVLYVKKTEIPANSILAAAKVSVLSADGILLDSSPLAGFRFKGKKGSIKGKLLTEKDTKKLPVAHVMVTLLNLKTGREEPDSCMTDVYGDFEIGVSDESASYSILVKSPSPGLENVILATESGQEISRLRKTEKGFEYKLIPADIELLTDKETEDISLIFSKFGRSQETNLKVTEKILYPLGQYRIEDEGSKKILDKVVRILKEHPKVTLEVISHTDAQGDDASNLLLSEKRAAEVTNYFIAKGISKTRLKAIGKGETEIRNRCLNQVDCSDQEHEYNRRTEFKFRKG